MESATKLNLNALLDKFLRILNVFVKKLMLIMELVKNALIILSLILKELDVYVRVLLQFSEMTSSNVSNALWTQDLMVIFLFVLATPDIIRSVKTVFWIAMQMNKQLI